MLLNEVADKYFEKLGMFTVANTRARGHGKNHLEAFELQKLFSILNEKIQTARPTNPNLGEECTQFRETTNNYAIPSDVCETYAAVYDMLSETDHAYQA